MSKSGIWTSSTSCLVSPVPVTEFLYANGYVSYVYMQDMYCPTSLVTFHCSCISCFINVHMCRFFFLQAWYRGLSCGSVHVGSFLGRTYASIQCCHEVSRLPHPKSALRGHQSDATGHGNVEDRHNTGIHSICITHNANYRPPSGRVYIKHPMDSTSWQATYMYIHQCLYRLPKDSTNFQDPLRPSAITNYAWLYLRYISSCTCTFIICMHACWPPTSSLHFNACFCLSSSDEYGAFVWCECLFPSCYIPSEELHVFHSWYILPHPYDMSNMFCSRCVEQRAIVFTLTIQLVEWENQSNQSCVCHMRCHNWRRSGECHRWWCHHEIPSWSCEQFYCGPW